MNGLTVGTVGPRSRSPSPSRKNHDLINLAQVHEHPLENSEEHRSEKHPLIDAEPVHPKPPLATSETDELESDDRDTVNGPYPGIDDGFFIEDRAGEIPSNGVPTEKQPDDIDGQKKPPIGPSAPDFPGRFPYAPGFGLYDPETGATIPDLESIPDVNVYQHKKTLAQGMMDLALFSANANQLRYVLESSSRHPYFYPSLVLITISLMFQVAVGVGLIWNSRYNVKDKKEICIANKINNFTVIGIFLVTVINVFISAFGVASGNPAT